MIPWCSILVDEDLRRARRVALAIAAMEFPVRIRHAVAGSPDPLPGEGVEEPDGPWVVEVQDLHWVDLDGVLEDIIREQDDFDDRLDRIEARSLRWQRVALLFVVVVVSVLAAFGLVEV